MALKPPTTTRLAKIYKIISDEKVPTWTVRSVFARRFRDPENPGKPLPKHKSDSIDRLKKQRNIKMIKLLEKWLEEAKKEFKIV